MIGLEKLYFKDPKTGVVSEQWLEPFEARHALTFKDQWSREPWPEPKPAAPKPPPPPPPPAAKSK